ncbi:MAG: hypothetical protein H0W06_03295 [Chloroflexia bacterium]|nr:hypothetical protein [Chloroflexia bacterium]
MPWDPGVSKHLTDEQLWALVCADPAVSNRQLADALGAPKATVASARWRLRRHGWTCPVSYEMCRHCGRPLTRQGNGQERRAYHPDCRPVAVQELRKPRDRRRWDALPVEERRDSFARAHAYIDQHQEATQATATQRHGRWTAEEDAVLIARHAEPAHVLATELGRTLYGVYRRRDRLSDRGLLPKR